MSRLKAGWPRRGQGGLCLLVLDCQDVVHGKGRARVRGIGGLRDVRPAADLPLDAPHLTITGLALFGGFAVQAELPPHADELVEAVARAEASLPAAPETLPGVEAVPAV